MNTILFLGLVLTGYYGPAVTETEHWQETFAFAEGSAPRIVVENVWGPISIRTHDSPDVAVAAREVRSARDADALARSRDFLYLIVDHRADGLTIRLSARDGQRHEQDPCPGCRLEVAFELTVPAGAVIEASTVMDGSVDIAGVGNVARASNVNGDVFVSGLVTCRDLSTVNGTLDAVFAAPPDLDECAVHTINGDMTVALPPGSHAEFDFDLFNGGVRSDFELEPLPAKPEITREVDDSVTRVRLRTPSLVRLGRGGPRLTFESINGDVHIVATGQ